MIKKGKIDQPDAAPKIMNPKLRSAIVEQNGNVMLALLAIEK